MYRNPCSVLFDNSMFEAVLCLHSRSFPSSLSFPPSHRLVECVLTGNRAQQQSFASKGDIFRETVSFSEHGSTCVKSILPGGRFKLQSGPEGKLYFFHFFFSGKVMKLASRRSESEGACSDR